MMARTITIRWNRDLIGSRMAVWADGANEAFINKPSGSDGIASINVRPTESCRTVQRLPNRHECRPDWWGTRQAATCPLRHRAHGSREPSLVIIVPRLVTPSTMPSPAPAALDQPENQKGAGAPITPAEEERPPVYCSRRGPAALRVTISSVFRRRAKPPRRRGNLAILLRRRATTAPTAQSKPGRARCRRRQLFFPFWSFGDIHYMCMDI